MPTSSNRRSKAAIPALRWTGQALLAFVLAWMTAHFITLGFSSWGPGSQGEATALGQVIALLALPVLMLLIFGLRNRLQGLALGISVCVLAGLATLIHH
ncbi:hypothetical protein GMO_01670 [Gluconobacter morbifer G707]|uniref:Uncharacterized protein n=1 Tax=Gluconobacter morbifer G707 TaxID=1088869 RepID=G6XFA2_9PROT|nr:hypothetical protein GMO_01670 [Gluconobacter morbifer G707]